VIAGSWQRCDDGLVIITWIGVVLTLLGAAWLVVSLFLLGDWLRGGRVHSPPGASDFQ